MYSMSVGGGIASIALTFSGSGFNPLSVIRCPRNVSDFRRSSIFDLFSRIPTSRDRCRRACSVVVRNSFTIRETNTIHHDVICNTVDAFHGFDGLLELLLADL